MAITAHKVTPKKRMGQHFLVDQEAIARIVGAVTPPTPAALVVEIGPGMGAISGGLLDRFGERLHCLEVDREAIAYLSARFPTLGERLHATDCLRFDYDSLGVPEFVLVGNLPYNISSQILFQVKALRERVPSAVFMLQREVAYRLAARPKTKENGILSILLQTYFDIEVLFDLPPASFDPPPKVYSSVVRLVRNGRAALPCDALLFEQVVKGAFNQRRKMLRNSLEAALGCDVSDLPQATFRPEALGVEEFIALTTALAGRIGAQDGASPQPPSQG